MWVISADLRVGRSLPVYPELRTYRCPALNAVMCRTRHPRQDAATPGCWASRKVWTRSIPANILRARRRARLRTFPTSGAMVSTLAALSVYSLGYAIVPQSNSSRGNEMTTQSSHASPILVTGAAGAVGSIGRNVTEMLLAKGHKVRALVRREDERAEALRQLGAEVMQGDLTDLVGMHRAIEGCARVYFGMSVSAEYLTATVNTAAVARHHGVEAFVNMSQMTVTQMSVTESTDSPQH